MAKLINDLHLAAKALQQGQVVAFPTETVCGLGASALSFDACNRIYQLKGRPSFNPLIVHVADLNQAKLIGEFSDIAIKLAEKFWPGPLTLVVKLKQTANIASNVTAGLDTIAIRVSAHPITSELLKLANIPIAAPSANLSGYVTSTSPQHVLNDFTDKDLYVLSSDEASQYCGLESTIIDTTGKLTILRSGVILPPDIQEVCGIWPETCCQDNDAPKAPGMLLAHYSPVSKLRLNAAKLKNDEVGLDFNNHFTSNFSLSKSGNLEEAAHNLYALLREADRQVIQKGLKGIAVAKIPYVGIGIAINDRLFKAASKK
ncbi:translation factor protein [Candidatus Phycorickettsia trachydisci]|uniref:Threonylcarbamoyl-AMP synthase n=1 Tax=Candidatus Phycorickettsia trachydisci TaxID=2115978 RepID=A0A2P1P903_9RICK|nr:L-threonylcarbamoyladenylate synthase [Candidatus Phycorickettsia trachydisci]AVP87752.1 translation factor protein [Candidatus Phycorickettsia trachydisci]